MVGVVAVDNVAAVGSTASDTRTQNNVEGILKRTPVIVVGLRFIVPTCSHLDFVVDLFKNSAPLLHVNPEHMIHILVHIELNAVVVPVDAVHMPIGTQQVGLTGAHIIASVTTITPGRIIFQTAVHIVVHIAGLGMLTVAGPLVVVPTPAVMHRTQVVTRIQTVVFENIDFTDAFTKVSSLYLT